MTSNDLLDLLRYLAALPATLFWPSVAWILDHLRRVGGVGSAVLALLLTAVPVGFAILLQRTLNRKLQAAPAAPLGFGPFLKLELWHSVLALPLWPFRLPFLLVRGIARLFQGATRRLKRRKAAQQEPAAAPADDPKPQAEPLVVATLGPGFLLAGLAAAVLYLVARLIEPLLASSLELSPGLSAWQYLFLGYRPELAWYLPLDRFPFLGGLLTLLLWLAIWSVLGIVVRLVFQRQLGRNLKDEREDEMVLPAWRQWFGVPFLWAPVASYKEWAGWLVAAALPLLAWAWLSLGGDPYRLYPSEMAVALVLWTSWSLHLVLRGYERLPLEEEAVEEGDKTKAAGWPEVLAHLDKALHVTAPEPLQVRPVEPLGQSQIDPRTAALLSPLLSELLPQPRRFTPMQHAVLTRLSHQGYVHTDPPVVLDKLELGETTLDAAEDQDTRRSRNLIVLAPEGAGKTTLTLLAAANHALVHTRGTLVVVRGEDEAERLAQRFRRAIEPSTLRWNVRVRHPGTDLMNDLAQGILPDVIVCSLHDLTVMVLDRAETFAPFLRALGLIVVDDVEAFAGPVEVHAQLAFRRLMLRVREVIGVRELGEKSVPQILILGADSMHRMAEWVRSLCSVDAVLRSYCHSLQEAREREKAAMDASGLKVVEPEEETKDKEEAKEEGTAEPASAAPAAPSALEQGRHQKIYRLRDFTSSSGPLGFADLVGVCERLAVPWHYRLCGDGRRDLGRGPLLLREEPVHWSESPEGACVVLLEGTWSEVRREIERLRRAGARFRRFRSAGGPAGKEAPETGAEPIALIVRFDPDLEGTFEEGDESHALSAVLESLPRPVIRPPTGLAVEPHLAADLVQRWFEVQDVVEVFGGAVVRRLRELARQGLLLAEKRTDVDQRANQYIERVHVRALVRAVRSADEEEDGGYRGGDLGILLPPKVGQVDFTVRSTVAIRDRTSLTVLGRTGTGTAHILYYPGRIFQDARGVFVVVGRASDEGGGRRAAGDVLVEPLLTDEVSSPRRLLRPHTLPRHQASPELIEAAGGVFPAPDLVLMGRYPFRVALEPVEIEVEHIATCRLDPVRREVRQRTLLEREAREGNRALRLPTVALAIFPNPEETADADPGDALSLDAARLLAAALRAVLPSLYRGAADSLQVALRLQNPEEAAPDHILGPEEGFYLFDADAGGNGTARAIHRDGIDLLFRICRLVLEKMPALDWLRTLYDEWGSEAEILEESRYDPRFSAEPAGHEEGDEQARQRALAWLDSRLQPEGGMTTP